LRDAYAEFVRASFEDAPSMMLSSLLQRANRTNELHGFLRRFSDKFDEWLPIDEPDESSDLILDLEGRTDGPELPFVDVCRYFESFHSGLRELTKSGAPKRGSTRDAALRATAYATPEITTIPRMGGGSTVRLQLTQPHSKQLEFHGPDDLERGAAGAIGVAARVLQWAGSDVSNRAATALPPTAKERVDVAFQAMKMLPESGSIASVRLGGRLLGLGSGASVEMKPQHSEQLLSIIQAEQLPTSFDESGPVRALDLDQSWFRLRAGSSAVKCWTKKRRDLLEKANVALAAHGSVRVIGQMITVRSRKWVMVEDVV
jgi:hypothetical protein